MNILAYIACLHVVPPSMISAISPMVIIGQKQVFTPATCICVMTKQNPKRKYLRSSNFDLQHDIHKIHTSAQFRYIHFETIPTNLTSIHTPRYDDTF